MEFLAVAVRLAEGFEEIVVVDAASHFGEGDEGFARVLGDVESLAVFKTVHVEDLEGEHRVMRDHGPAGFGHEGGMIHPALVENPLHGIDEAVTILVDRVVGT